MKALKTIACSVTIGAALTLGGCASIISATSEEPIAEDTGSRTWGSYVEDEVIENKALVNISKGSEELRNANIAVTSYNGVVLLTGQVPSDASRQEAENIANQVRKVRKIHNELTVSGPVSTIVKSNDIYLTSRIKVELLANEQVEGGRIKVVTENGVVYMMGLVSSSEADAAVNIVRSVSGVQKIVKVFEYVNR